MLNEVQKYKLKRELVLSFCFTC